jgi:hypothetical protein
MDKYKKKKLKTFLRTQSTGRHFDWGLKYRPALQACIWHFDWDLKYRPALQAHFEVPAGTLKYRPAL